MWNGPLENPDKARGVNANHKQMGSLEKEEAQLSLEMLMDHADMLGRLCVRLELGASEWKHCAELHFFRSKNEDVTTDKKLNWRLDQVFKVGVSMRVRCVHL